MAEAWELSELERLFDVIFKYVPLQNPEVVMEIMAKAQEMRERYEKANVPSDRDLSWVCACLSERLGKIDIEMMERGILGKPYDDVAGVYKHG